MSILDGFIRGSRQGSNYYDSLNRRELANAENARAERRLQLDENQDKRLGNQETRAAEEGRRKVRDDEQGQRAQRYSDIFRRGRNEEFVMADSQTGQIRLSDTFKDRLASGDPLAQNYAVEVFNAGGRGKLPEGFKIDRINRSTDADGNAVYFVGGVNADGSKGVITTDGTSSDDSTAKAFTADELFNQTKMAFRSKDGVLYGQQVIDLGAYANTRDFIVANTQEAIFDRLKSDPAAQRDASAVIANAETEEEELEVTNLLAESVGVPVAEVPPEAVSDQGNNSEPADNSAQVAEPERATKEFRASIRQQVQEAGGSANTQALEYKRLMNEAGYDTFGRPLAPEKPKDGNDGRTRGERKFAPLPPIVEQQVAPAVDGKTLEQIDEAIDNGELQIDQETAAAAAQDLQGQGVETAADLAKLDPRRQAFAYAMIIASTPNDGNRRAVRDQLINILETGVSDRGASSVALRNAATSETNAETSLGRLVFDVKKYTEGISDGYRETANELFEEIQDVIYPVDSETGQAASARLNSQSANTLANRVVPKLRRQKAELLRNGSPADIKSIQALMNQTLSFMVQSLASDTDPGMVDSFLNYFNPDPNGNYDGDLSNIYKRDGKYVYGQLNRDGTVRPQGDPISAGQLKALNVNIFPLIDAAATENEERASKLRAGAD